MAEAGGPRRPRGAGSGPQPESTGEGGWLGVWVPRSAPGRVGRESRLGLWRRGSEGAGTGRGGGCLPGIGGFGNELPGPGPARAPQLGHPLGLAPVP